LQGNELADTVPFGVDATTEETAYVEETAAPGEPVASPHKIAMRRPRRLGRFIGGGLLLVAVTAGVTYITLPGKSSVAMPPIAAAVSSPKVMLTDNGEQNMPSNESIDGTHTGGIGKKASVASDDAAALGARPAAGVAPASDADADQVSAGKATPGASPAPAAITPAETGGVPASASGDATPASDDSAGAGGDASAVSAAAAIGSQPPTKPADRPPGGVFIQFSAQKSETAARSSYHGLRTKFPTILGKLDPNIQRADLGDKGIFYRVRVGPFALADAQKICGSYKAVGGSDCLIARR
jgi:hypothetical protein